MGLPEASKHLFQTHLQDLTDSIYISFLLKKEKNPTPKRGIYCQQNLIFLPHFLLYLFFINPHRMGKKTGWMRMSQS